MQVFLATLGTVFMAEMGDKTQLLALCLATRYRRPVPIVAGILLATALNHAGAGGLGFLLADWMSAEVLRWILFASFLVMAAWILVPDKLDEGCENVTECETGILCTTTTALFLAEMGDKTQIATVAIAAQFHAFWAVVAGSVGGMLFADVPAVFLGQKFADSLPKAKVRMGAAILLVIMAGWSLANALGLID